MVSQGNVQDVFPRLRYAAQQTTFGSDVGKPKSGYFSLHFTYPDTEYGDATETTWAAGGNQQGMHFLIRTPIAGDITDTTTNGATGQDTQNGVNFQVIDLKRAAEANAKAREDGSCPANVPVLTYDLGTEEASRLIASTINSSRHRQLGMDTTSRYLRARYVKMSGSHDYTAHVKRDSAGLNWNNLATLANNPYVCEMGESAGSMSWEYRGKYTLPSDIPPTGSITYGSTTLYYDSYEITRRDSLGLKNEIAFNFYKIEGSTVAQSMNTEFTINNDQDAQHTVVVSWECDTPSGGGYWGTANNGPVVQGLGTDLPVWYLAAKPMDGGNMGLPAINHESRGATPIKDADIGSPHSLNRGFSRFSIEGLNSCQLPDMPPPDNPFDGPVIMGSASAKTHSGGQGWNNEGDTFAIDDLEHGTQMDKMGPYPSGCFVSSGFAGGGVSNSNANTPLGSTVLKVLTPNAEFDSVFTQGSVLYKSDGTVLATIGSTEESVVKVQKLNDTGLDSGDLGVKANGVSHRKTGTKLAMGDNFNFAAPGTLAIIKIEGTDPTGVWSGGEEVFFKASGNDYISVGTIGSGVVLKRNSANAPISIGVGGGTSGSKTLSNLSSDPREVFVEGEELYIGGALQGVIESMTATTLTTVANTTIAAGNVLQGQAITAKSLTFALSGVNFVGNSNYVSNWMNGEEIYLAKAQHYAGTNYTQADADDGASLVFTDGASRHPHDRECLGQVGVNGFSAYASAGTDPTRFGNPAAICDANGDPYVIGYPVNSRFNGGGNHSIEAFRVTTFVKEIPDNVDLYRKTILLTVSPTTSALSNGTELYFAPTSNKWQVTTENGYRFVSDFTKLEATSLTRTANISHNSEGRYDVLPHFTNVNSPTTTTAAGALRWALGNNQYNTSHQIGRPFRITRTVNSERVKGLQISNEERVWDNLTVVDDAGVEHTIEGGSPFGTVIKDYQIKTERVDAETGLYTTLPSTPSSGIEPNLEIQLPSPEEIPGNIIVRSGHDRVQAWRNMTWGMGGLNAPSPLAPGVKESNLDPALSSNGGGATQFDTHDRMLHFHPVRILHDTLSTQFGLTPNTTPGAVPSGTTRLFAAHRLNDHVERGSVLNDTVNGVAGSVINPHNRIRFGRQGHHFVAPLTTRGTPKALRRQLHRSHGSAYSLMFEAETENKHWGFVSAYSSGSGNQGDNAATSVMMDTIEVKASPLMASTHAGSFASDGFPMDAETIGRVLPNHAVKWSQPPLCRPDILFSPGQTLVAKEGTIGEQAHFINRGMSVGMNDTTHHTAQIKGLNTYIGSATPLLPRSGPIQFGLRSSRTVNNRFNTGEEFMVNGFFISHYNLMGGRPQPTTILTSAHTNNESTYSVQGHLAGNIYPRVSTELATVPPLMAHDPELVNMSAAPIMAGHANDNVIGSQTEAHNDLALLKATDTNSNVVPDAFLCTWLAEYSHPALFGTVREQYMTFRYRQAGMPRSVNYPPTKNILLRNAESEDSVKSVGLAKVAEPFERLYAFQWMQNFGYNGLNAGGHGSDWGLRSASAVLMGHTTIREAHGTLRLAGNAELNPLLPGVPTRYSRGEGIGDGFTPNSIHSTNTIDEGYWTNAPTTVVNAITHPFMAIDVSRRLPVRAWGMRGASDALNMLAGDPSQTAANNTAQQAITNSARFDGGIHDTMQKLPNTAEYGDDWNWPKAYAGVERTVPIGMVWSNETTEATQGAGSLRLSNDPWKKGEKKIGYGRRSNHEELGMIDTKAMPSGSFDSLRTEFATTTGTDAKFLQAKSINTGLDPIIGLSHHSGDATKAADSIEAKTQTTAFEASGGNPFIHHKGNNLHINAHPVDVFTGTTLGSSSAGSGLTHDDFQHHFPAHGWGRDKNMKDKTQAERGVSPIPLSEITDHRQVQSDGSPRFGIVSDTHGDDKDYIVTSTKAVSLHSDLAIGQKFPVMPSWVSHTRWTKHGITQSGSANTVATFPDEIYGTANKPNQPTMKPHWGLDAKGVITLANGDTTHMVTGQDIVDAWAVRGSADLPAWGGVYILRKTMLHTENEGLRQIKGASGALITNNRTQAGQPIRKTIDYVVRMVRPLKMFAFASAYESQSGLSQPNYQDGWLLGAHSTLSAITGYADQPFTRDNRYGIFEIDDTDLPGALRPIGSIDGPGLKMEWPDANYRDETWHLIPTANMLQHFKADASRKDSEGRIDANVDARYSQSTHPGGGETINQSSARAGSGALAPFPSLEDDDIAISKQADHTMTMKGPIATVKQDKSTPTGGTLVVDNARPFPASGYLIIEGFTGEFKYTSRTRDTFVLDTTDPATGDCEVTADVAGQIVRYGRNLGTDTAICDTTAAANTQNWLVSTTGAGFPISGLDLFVVGETIHTTNGTLGMIASLDVSTSRIYFTANIPIAITAGDVLRGTNNRFLATDKNIIPFEQPIPVLPSFVDNAVSIASTHTDKWDGVDDLDIKQYNPNISYRGLGHYEPNDFFFLTPQLLVLSDGAGEGSLSYVKKAGVGGLKDVYVDGNIISSTKHPPYLLGSDGLVWRVSGVKEDATGGSRTPLLQFKNTTTESLSKDGITVDSVRLGHYGGLGMRSSDMALAMINDLDATIKGADIAGFSLSYEPVIVNSMLPSATGLYVGSGLGLFGMITANTNLFSVLSAHPDLMDTVLHSKMFVSRKARGMFLMEVLKHLSQMDGHQLIITPEGEIMYSPNIFLDRDRRVGSSSGAQMIEVSNMMEMANKVIVTGEKVAENEEIRAEVEDLEKIKEMGGKGEEGVVRTAIHHVSGLEDNNLALKMAKSIMRRTELGASVIRVEGLLQCTDIQPGEILNVDFTAERIKGQFIVFEAYHDYTKGTTNLVIGQYEKGIEGLVADLQTATGSGAAPDPSRTRELTNVSLTAPIKVVASARIMTRMVNHQRMIIGGTWRNTFDERPLIKHGTGCIGLKGGRTGKFSSSAHAANSTTTLTFTGGLNWTRFNVGDMVEVRNVATTANTNPLTTNYDQWQFVGIIATVPDPGTNTITLTANNAVAIANGAELRVIHKRAVPIGMSKSVFYKVS